MMINTRPMLPMVMGGVLLAVFGVLGTLLVSLTYEATAERIASNEREILLRQIRLLVPQELIDNDPLVDTLVIHAEAALGVKETTVYRGRHGAEPVALVLSPVSAKGYNGEIKLIIAVAADGHLTGVRVLTHRETPGLGDKVEEKRSDWILGFKGHSLLNPTKDGWRVKRDGGDFDQFTGATITPRGIVQAVYQTLQYVEKHQQELFAPIQQPNTANPSEIANGK